MSKLVYSSLCILAFTIISCERPSELESMRAREMARTDTIQPIFFNYELGMSRQAFYDSSWALNARGMVVHGPNNRNIQYKLPDQLDHQATMLFYPDFNHDRVSRMRVLYSYDGWAPWNRHLWSDSLIHDVRDLMESWYGEGFLTQQVSIPLIGTSNEYVKIDANRQITIQRHTDREVLVYISDLNALLHESHE